MSNEERGNELNDSNGSVSGEVLPPYRENLEGAPVPKPSGTMRIDTPEGTSRYFKKRFAEMEAQNTEGTQH